MTLRRHHMVALSPLACLIISLARASDDVPPSPPRASGPVIELPPTGEAPPSAAPDDTDPSIASGQAPALQLGSGRRIPVGAYGEAQLFRQGDQTQLTLRRVVLFFGHRFDDRFSVYTELEVEDAQRFEIEQSYVEIAVSRNLGLRAGLLLVPLGIINLYHEPPTFNGVDRPVVDQLIIPTTWRELGAGAFGTIADGLHVQLYVVDGADGSKFTADEAIGPGLNRGFQINTENVAATGRLNFNRVLGLDVAAGFYYGTANNSSQMLAGIRVGIVEADARFSRWGLLLRAEYARIFIAGADRLTQALRMTVPSAAAIGSAAHGFYAEAGYNVLHRVGTLHALIPFARYEYVDARAGLPDVSDPLPSEALQYATVGITYRPRPEIAFKVDYRRRLAGDDRQGTDRVGAGIGFMY